MFFGHCHPPGALPLALRCLDVLAQRSVELGGDGWVLNVGPSSADSVRQAVTKWKRRLQHKMLTWPAT